MKIFKFKKPEKGFTLTELLVIVAIIGIFASVISPNLLESRAKARDAKRVSELKDLEQAVELYFQNYYQFPAVIADLSPYYDDQSTLTDTDYKYNKVGSSYCLGAKMEVMSNAVSCDLGVGTEVYNYRIAGPGL